MPFAFAVKTTLEFTGQAIPHVALFTAPVWNVVTVSAKAAGAKLSAAMKALGKNVFLGTKQF